MPVIVAAILFSLFTQLDPVFCSLGFLLWQLVQLSCLLSLGGHPSLRCRPHHPCHVETESGPWQLLHPLPDRPGGPARHRLSGPLLPLRLTGSEPGSLNVCPFPTKLLASHCLVAPILLHLHRDAFKSDSKAFSDGYNRASSYLTSFFVTNFKLWRWNGTTDTWPLTPIHLGEGFAARTRPANLILLFDDKKLQSI